MQEKEKLKIFDLKKPMRKIVGLKTENETESRQWMNREIEEWQENENIVKAIKLKQ